MLIVTTNPNEPALDQLDPTAAVQAELRTSSYAALRNVSCIVDGGQFVLTGTVPTFYLKQMAQTILLRCVGAASPFRNRLQVVSHAER